MKRINMNLRMKTLWLPALIMLAAIVVTGIEFTYIITNNADQELKESLQTFVSHEVDTVEHVLAILTSTQVPADAIMGVESGDNVFADEMGATLKPLGPDSIYLADLKGNVIYPAESGIPDRLKKIMTSSKRRKGHALSHVIGKELYTYAPVYDVDAPAGYLIMKIDIPDEVAANLDVASSISTGRDDSESVSRRMSLMLNETKNRVRAVMFRTLTVTAATMLTLILLIVIILHVNSRRIVDTMGRLIGSFRLQAGGDMSQRLTVETGDEMEELADQFNTTNRRICGMINDVKSRADDLTGAVDSLAREAQSVVANSSEQMNKTSMAAAALEELSASFNEVVQNTSLAAESAKKATSLAVDGGELVTETIHGIEKIATSVENSSDFIEKLGKRSEEIGKIVQVINDIAEQTNLLALNAAIEAARAGEQGRGFAVVADEVRQLAERTKSATKEINSMITAIQSDTGNVVNAMNTESELVQKGVQLANEAGRSLHEIVTSIHTVYDMINQISTAAEEQSTTGQHITQHLETVAELAKKTDLSINSTVEITMKLNEMAHDLHELLNGFKTDISAHTADAEGGIVPEASAAASA